MTLINNVLDGAKIEANKLELDTQMKDLQSTLIKAVSLYYWKAKEKKLNLSLKLGKNFPDNVEFDEPRLT